MRHPLYHLIVLPLVAIVLFSSLLQAKSYTVAVELISFPPFIQTDHQENFTGYLRDVLDLWSRDRGHQLVFEVLPVKRVAASLKAGKIDLRIPDNPAWEAEEKRSLSIHYSQPIATVHGGYVKLASTPPLSKITNRVPIIGSMLGFTHTMIADKIQQGKLSIHEAPHTESLISLLRLKRLDAIFGDIPSLIRLGNSTIENDQVVQCEELPSEKSPYHFSAVTNHAVIQDFDLWLKQPATAQKLLEIRRHLTIE